MSQTPKPAWVLKIYKYLYYWNNILLIPLFTVMLLEAGVRQDPPVVDYNLVNLGFCVFFIVEWLLGLYVSQKRREYLTNPTYVADLISAIPFGYLFQGLRIVRLMRVTRVLRIILRARRFHGTGARLVKTAGIVGATAFAGAMGIRVVEPQTFTTFADAIWWSIVTMSTVGYGDITPVTDLGRFVASILIIFGIGVFGYVAGFTASVLDDTQEDSMVETLARLEERVEAMQYMLEMAYGVGGSDELDES